MKSSYDWWPFPINEQTSRNRTIQDKTPLFLAMSFSLQLWYNTVKNTILLSVSANNIDKLIFFSLFYLLSDPWLVSLWTLSSWEKKATSDSLEGKRVVHLSLVVTILLVLNLGFWKMLFLKGHTFFYIFLRSMFFKLDPSLICWLIS